jgi:CubicO group peptidase (beta-lactamase class C family)
MSRRWLGAFLALALGVGCTPSPPTSTSPPQLFGPPKLSPPLDPDRRARLTSAIALLGVERKLSDYVARNEVPGLAFAVVGQGGLLWTSALGVRNLETREPVTEDTVFRVGSITKLFTGLALLELRDQGRISFDVPLVSYVPELGQVTYPTHDSPLITLRHVVTHSSGLPRLGDVGSLGGIALDFAPGVDREYSNLAAAIAGLVIARAGGVPYGAYVERALLGPLGMTSSGFAPAAAWGNRIATGYRFAGAGWQPAEVTPPGPTDSVGHLYSTLHDLALFTAFELGAWPPRDDPETGPVQRSTVRESQLVAGQQPATPAGYGVFWHVFSDCVLSHGVSHDGRIDGFFATIILAPRQGLGVIALTNAREVPQPEGGAVDAGPDDDIGSLTSQVLHDLLIADAGDAGAPVAPCVR